MKHFIIPLVCLCLMFWGHLSSTDAKDLDSYSFSTAQQELLRITQTDLQNTSLAQLDTLILQVEAYVNHGKQCASMAQQELEQTEKALAALGEKVAGEPREVSSERNGLQVAKNQAEVSRAQCRLLSLRASDLAQKLNNTKKRVFTRDLLAQGPGILELVQAAEIRSTKWLQMALTFFKSESGLSDLLPYHLTFSILFAGVGFFLGRKVSSLVFAYGVKIEEKSLFFDFLRIARQHKKSFHIIGALTGVALFVHLFMADLQPPPYFPSTVNSLLFGLIILTFAKIYTQFLAQESRVEDSDLQKTATGLFRLYLLALLSGMLWFVLTSPLQAVLPEPVFYLIRALTVTFWYATLLWAFWLACSFSWLHAWRRTVRLFLLLLLGSVILAELSGYRVLAIHILTGTTGTIGLIILLVFCRYLANEAVGGFGRGRYVWQQTIRQKAGVEKTHILKGLVWTNSFLKLSLVIVFIYCFLRLWGISRVYSSAFFDWLVEGFNLGTITIVPTRIGVGFLIFALGWSGVSLVKDKIIRTWLAESELAPSVQDALSTVLGYVGYSLVILFGLSTAGISFSGLAIVAGALSVGIGFGLQNIVNNLVSGLILLVERPIKRGDWIVVGTTEGYVKKISVRSTIIQTFERSDVIVPNSELISNQVTNMMLRDTRGRVRVAVGVAYGSDTALVKKILLEVAKNHPEVITNGSSPYPVVRFQAFGESSLDFELFCHLRDVDKRIDVRSDMHFAIDNAFRKHGVEIPFAQRDLHIRSGLPVKMDGPGSS